MSIDKEFSKATRAVTDWAESNEDRFGADPHNVLNGVFDDGSMEVCIGETAKDLHSARLSIQRTTRNNHEITEVYTLDPNKGLTIESYGYPTQLIEVGKEGAEFSQGIGDKRQKRAIRVLARFAARSDGDW